MTVLHFPSDAAQDRGLRASVTRMGNLLVDLSRRVGGHTREIEALKIEIEALRGDLARLTAPARGAQTAPAAGDF